MLVLEDFDPCTRLEHHDHVTLVEDVGRGVEGHAGEVLDLLGVAIKVDWLGVHQNVQLVAPLGVAGTETNLVEEEKEENASQSVP